MGSSVVVLMYHHILPEGGFITTPVDLFRRQMEYLVEAGYQTLTLSQFYRFKRGELEIEKGVVITFDDGWRDNYHYAYPILKELGLNGVLFVVTEWVEEASQHPAPFNPLPHNRAKRRVKEAPGEVVVNWEQLEEMEGVFEVASHTHSHRDFYFGKEYSWEEEFELSRTFLEKQGWDTTALCWPRGYYTPQLLSLARNYFHSFWTTERGPNLPDSNLTQIKRLAVKNEGLGWFKKSLFLFRQPLIATLYSKVKRR